MTDERMALVELLQKKATASDGHSKTIMARPNIRCAK